MSYVPATRTTPIRRGFTLIELVVVIMILGILAAVAAPKFFNTSSTATENGVKQTLSIVRDAVQMYIAQNNGSKPPCTGTGDDFKLALAPYIRGAFPVCPVGAHDDEVVPATGTPVEGDASPASGWKFYTDSGDFIANTQDTAPGSGLRYDSF